MSPTKRSPPETVLAQRSLEIGQALRDGELVSRIENDGESRVVRVSDGTGAIRCTLARFPASDTRGRLLPDWAPFVPDVELMITETAGRRFLVFDVLSGVPGQLQEAATPLNEALEGVGLEEAGSLRRPDGSVDPDVLATYMDAFQAALPAGAMSQLSALWSGGGMDTGRLDRAWEALRSWYRDRGWAVEDREMNAPQSVARSCRFSRGSDRHDATASSMMGSQHILVFVQHQEGGS
jgi:hypothetical protein